MSYSTFFAAQNLLPPPRISQLGKHANIYDSPGRLSQFSDYTGQSHTTSTKFSLSWDKMKPQYEQAQDKLTPNTPVWEQFGLKYLPEK